MSYGREFQKPHSLCGTAETTMNRFYTYLDTWWARVGTGLAVAVALLPMLPPISTWKPDLTNLTMFATAVMAWLLTALKGPAAEPHPHDIALFRELMNLLDDDQRALLKEADFIICFKAVRTRGIKEIREIWHGGRYRFQDRLLASSWQDLKCKIDAFVDLMVEHTWQLRHMSGFLTVTTDIDQQLGRNGDETKANARALNDAAILLTEALDEFESKARRRLRV